MKITGIKNGRKNGKRKTNSLIRNMMKYKLINKQTGEQHLCDKVTIDGFEYYLSDEKINPSDWIGYPTLKHWVPIQYLEGDLLGTEKKIIASNNPNIDIPKVVDEIQINKEKNQNLIDLINFTLPNEQLTLNQESIIYHHNKSQETHLFSEEDMIGFGDWLVDYMITEVTNLSDSTKELLKIWKEQQIKTLYYELT